MAPISRFPAYRRHKQSGQGIVSLPDGFGGRRDVLLGTYGTVTSRRVENWLATGIAVMLIMVPPCRRVFRRELFLLDQRLQTSRTHSLNEGFVVQLVLVGIGDRELGNRLVKSVAFAKVAGDQCRLSGAGVSAG